MHTVQCIWRAHYISIKVTFSLEEGNYKFLGFAWSIVLLSHSHSEIKYFHNLVWVLGPYLVQSSFPRSYTSVLGSLEWLIDFKTCHLICKIDGKAVELSEVKAALFIWVFCMHYLILMIGCLICSYTPYLIFYHLQFNDKLSFSKLLFQSTESVLCLLIGPWFAEIKRHDENFVSFSATAGASRNYKNKQWNKTCSKVQQVWSMCFYEPW